MQKPSETPKSFEETYPHYPFAELVGLGIAVAQLIIRRKRRSERLFSEQKAAPRPEGRDAGTLASGSTG